MALARKLPLISNRPLAKAGLNSERVLMPNKGPGVFEEEIDGIEDALGITTVEKAVAWAQANSMWPDTFGLACCAIEMMSIVSSRYDISRFGMERFSSSPRQADLLIVSGRVTHKMAAPLRQVYDQMLEPKWVIAMGACASSGGMFNNYTVLQGVDKIVPVDIHVPGCPPRPEALMEGIVRLHEKIKAGVPPAYQIRGVAQVSYDGVPGLVETTGGHGETTLVVDAARIVEASTYLRDELGFNFLSDLTPTDYLGWGARGVSGYIGTPAGRDLHGPGTQGLARVPDAKPKRFAVNYHVLRLSDDPVRVRLQAWLDDGEEIDSVVPVWPTADWFEREAWDMFGIVFRGHPNLVRILMEDDWEGHPLRKDYPIGGEPVRFSGAE